MQLYSQVHRLEGDFEMGIKSIRFIGITKHSGEDVAVNLLVKHVLSHCQLHCNDSVVTWQWLRNSITCHSILMKPKLIVWPYETSVTSKCPCALEGHIAYGGLI